MAKSVIYDDPPATTSAAPAASGPKRVIYDNQPAQSAQPAQAAAPAQPQTGFWADPLNMKGLGAGLAQGVLNPVEGLVQLGLWPVVGPTSQDWLPGLRQAATGRMGAAGEFIGSALPFLAQPELGIGEVFGAGARFIPRVLGASPETVANIGNFLRGAYNIGQRSTLPSVLQPKDPRYMGSELAQQAALGTLFGEGLQAIAKLGGRRLDKFSRQDMTDWLNAHARNLYEGRKTAAEAEQAAQQATADMINRQNIRWHAGEVSSREAENALTEERNKQLEENYKLMSARAASQEVGSKVARQGALESQAQIPQQMTQRIYGLMANLARVGGPRSIGYRTSAQGLRVIGEKLDALYQQMHLDTSNPGMTRSLPAFFDETMQELRGSRDPNAAADWENIYNSYVSHMFNQGVLSGQQLTNYLSGLRNEINNLGLEAQAGRPASRIMANGLRNMLHAAEDVADTFDTGAKALGEERRRLNLAYELGARMNEASKGGRNPTPSPSDFLDAWEQADGPRHFGLDEKWVELKSELEQLEKDHTRKIPGSIPAVPPDKPVLGQPQKIPSRPGEVTPGTVEMPEEPKPRLGPMDRPPPPSAATEAAGGLAGALAHGHGIYPGAAARIARETMRGIGNLVPRSVARKTAQTRPYAPAATAGASHLTTRPRPLWIIRGPRGEDLGLANTNDPLYLRDKPPGSRYERAQ